MIQLRVLRNRSGLTLRQVEEATGLSNAYLSQLETGKIKHPSAQALYVLAKLYSTNVEDLLIDAGYIKDDQRVMPVPMKKTLEERVSDLENEVEFLKAKSIVYGR